MAMEDQAVPLLEMEGVRKRFGATLALDGVDLAVYAGEVLALMGENGAGKSTLMKMLSGAYTPDEGQMWIAGEPYHPRGPLDARKAGVTMIYQELSLAPHLSVAENILLGTEPTKGPLLDWRELKRQARAALDEMGQSHINLDAPAGSLSIAQQQLVEIARALALGSRVLVLDEPTSSLTAHDIEQLFKLVRSLRAKGCAIVYISHFLEEVKAIADRFTVLRDGRSVGTDDVASATHDKIISMMVGRSVTDLYPRSPRSPGEPVLEVKSLSGKKGRPIGASLTLCRGEVVGIAGLVGAGRTELLRTIFGLDPVAGGDVTIVSGRGGTVTGTRKATPHMRWASGVGMVSEDRKTEGLALTLSITDNATLSDLPAIVNPGKLERGAQQWIEKLSVKCQSGRQAIGDLSGGNQQKVAIARLLYHHADILLLDEPTRGIDIGAKAQIYKVIDELATRENKAVLIVSSYLPELLGLCDRVAVMSRGTLGVARPVGETNEHKILVEAVGGEPELGEAV